MLFLTKRSRFSRWAFWAGRTHVSSRPKPIPQRPAASIRPTSGRPKPIAGTRKGPRECVRNEHSLRRNSLDFKILQRYTQPRIIPASSCERPRNAPNEANFGRRTTIGESRRPKPISGAWRQGRTACFRRRTKPILTVYPRHPGADSENLDPPILRRAKPIGGSGGSV